MMRPLVTDKMMKGCSSEFKVLFISTCKEKLNELEYLNPVVELVKNSLKGKNYEMKIINYKELKDFGKNNLNNADLIVITGTALKDFDYFKYLDSFSVIKYIKTKKIGICAGAQILALVNGIKLKKLDKALIDVVYSNDKKYYFLTNYLIESESIKKNELNFNKEDIEIEEMEVNSKKYIIYFKSDNLMLFFYHPEVLNQEEFIKKLKAFIKIKE